MTRSYRLSSLVLACAVFAVACGDSKSSMNPVAPSAVVLGGSQRLDSGEVSDAQGKGGVPGPPAAPGLKKVEIEGLISAKSGDSITVNAQTVTVPSTCTIRHGQTPVPFAQLAVG